MRALSQAVFAAGVLFSATVCATPSRKPSPIPTPAANKGPSLSAAEKSQARKTLAAAVLKRQSFRAKAPAPSKASGGFQAHRCTVIYDQGVSGKERAANGPFRANCSDWVFRATKDLSVQDGQRPCTAMQFGPALVGCTSWADAWDAKSRKWVEVWRASVP